MTVTVVVAVFLSILLVSINYNDSRKYWDLALFNGMSLFTYIGLIYFVWRKRISCVNVAAFLVALYSILWGIIYIALYSSYTGDFFDFQRGDTMYYSAEVVRSMDSSFWSFIAELWKSQRWDDRGVLIYTRILYNVFTNPLFLYSANLVISLISFYFLYKLSKKLVSGRLAILVSTLFITSSYYIYFGVSLFKEQIFVLISIVLLAKIQDNLVLSKFKILTILQLIFLLFVLSLFRIATPLIILTSFLIYRVIVGFKLTFINVFSLLFVSIILALVIGPIFLKVYGSKVNLSFISYYILNSGYNMSGISQLMLSYFSSIFAPLPSVYPWENHIIPNFYYGGYLVKLMLSPFFIYGSKLSFFKEGKELRFLVIYYLLGSLIFGTAMRGFDIRFNITHSFVYYIVALYGFQNIKLKRKISYIIMVFWNASILAMLVTFNFR